jgi:hypothetical protein
MSTNIYEQAVAEAKKLREVAEQNAKNAIIEAITPRVRELIDRELSESSETIEDIVLESSGNEDDDIILEESAILELAKEIAGDKKEKEDDKKKEESKDSDDVVEMINRILNEEEDEEEKSSKSKKESHNNEDDMNLEELLNEIKMEIDFGEIEDDDIESALLELMPTVKMAAEEEVEAELDIEAEDAGEEKEEDGEEKLDFSSLMSDEGEEESDEEAQEEPVEEVFSINEAALSRELKRLRNNRSSNSTNETQDLNESRYREQLLKEQRNNRELKGELDEYRGAIENLRDQLNEMNLFNAKLLYVNKLLQTKGLDSSQKKTIIESIDSADSLREVKLVYKTLSESVNKKSTGSLNETKIRKLASSSSRPMKSGGSLLNESSNQVNRWARLAGLK